MSMPLIVLELTISKELQNIAFLEQRIEIINQPTSIRVSCTYTWQIGKRFPTTRHRVKIFRTYIS